MALDPTKNFAKTIVSIGYNDVATSIILTAGQGALLPNPAVSGAFNLVWWNQTDFPDPSDDPNKEIVRCTARTTDTLTIVRGQEGTIASTKNTVGKTYFIILAMTAKMVSDIDNQLMNPTNMLSLNTGQLAGFRNRIINGAMQISQRGTSFVSPASGAYTIDQFLQANTSAATFTISQDTTVYPPGFNSSLKVLLTTADAAVAATDRVLIRTKIEGSNIVGLDFGLATAKNITLSFWVYSNVAGVYCVSFNNSAGNRSIPIEYTINAANTWEKKSITLTGDVTGTWLMTTGVGIQLDWALMIGSSFQGTNNIWQAGNYFSTANQVNWAASLTGGSGGTAPTFYLTGVQLEQGAQATPFEFRSYGTELALCQRYLPCWNSSNNTTGGFMMGFVAATNTMIQGSLSLPVTTRVPVTSIVGTASQINTSLASGGGAGSGIAFVGSTLNSVSFNLTIPSGTSGQGGMLYFNTTTPLLYFNGAEL